MKSILNDGTATVTYKCKRLGLMGKSMNENDVNFESIPCSDFDSLTRKKKAEIALESLTVSHNDAKSYLHGGIRAKLNDGNPAYQTPTFKFDKSINY